MSVLRLRKQLYALQLKAWRLGVIAERPVEPLTMRELRRRVAALRDQFVLAGLLPRRPRGDA